MKYRKRNTVVEAQHCAISCEHSLVETTEEGWRMLTPEGWRELREGDWIVTDSSGVAWPMPDAVFTMLYEPCTDDK
ncbi:hypothetical protein WJ39_17860 [Burkholderia diffusa]|nr:hypothetical protein WJ39_17860 [Burkholderia diffusa]